MGDNSGIGGIDSIDIGVDLALIGLDRCGNGYCRGIGATTSQRGDVAVLIHTLEARDNDHSTCIQITPHPFAIDINNTSLVVCAIGEDLHLWPRIGSSRHATLLQRNGE